MYVCVCVCAYVCVCACMCMCVYAFARVCLSVCGRCVGTVNLFCVSVVCIYVFVCIYVLMYFVYLYERV